MNDAFHLAQLQKIDTQLDLINARLADIARLLADDVTVRNAEEQTAALAIAMRSAHNTLQITEEDNQAQRLKIELSEASLYGGKVRNPKELQEIQGELAALKRHLAALEDLQLEAMLALEQSEIDLKAAETALAAIRADFTIRSAGLIGEQSKLTRDFERLQAEREPVMAQITPASVEEYARLRRTKLGLAIAGVS